MIATWLDVAAEHVAAFVVGVGVGLALSNRYRIVRRNGDGTHS